MKILFLTNNKAVTQPLFDWIADTEGTENIVEYSEMINANHFESDAIFGDIDYIRECISLELLTK